MKLWRNWTSETGSSKSRYVSIILWWPQHRSATFTSVFYSLLIKFVYINNIEYDGFFFLKFSKFARMKSVIFLFVHFCYFNFVFGIVQNTRYNSACFIIFATHKR